MIDYDWLPKPETLIERAAALRKEINATRAMYRAVRKNGMESMYSLGDLLRRESTLRREREVTQAILSALKRNTYYMLPHEREAAQRRLGMSAKPKLHRESGD